MTFEKFELIVKEYRKDVIVSKHGDFCNNKSKNTLGVQFIKNGKISKVYDYSGTYGQVLDKLNIHYTTNKELKYFDEKLEKLIDENGTKGFFGIIDNTQFIEECKKEIEYLKTLPIIE